MTSCGLWLARRRLVAVLVGEGGEARRTIRAALTDDARYGLLEYLAQAGCEIVATEALARADLLPAQAARRVLTVWTIDDGFVSALVRAPPPASQRALPLSLRGSRPSRSCAPRSGASRRPAP